MSRTHRQAWLGAAALVAVALLVYAPVIRDAGFIWDDDDYVTENPELRDGDGLVRMWTDHRSLPQWYPLTHTTFWIEYQLWELSPRGYHADNVLLHALAAFLLWRILRRLGVPGGFVAALVFAVHPVHAESVAWITERKNVLSGVLYLGAALAWLRWLPADEGGRGRWALRFAGVAALFLAGLLSKTVVATLPCALLLVTWWKRGRLRARELLPAGLLFAAGAVMIAHTAMLEHDLVRARGADFDLGVLDRILVAGRAVWFYLSKLLWPHPLVFSYPKWDLASARAGLVAFPLAVVAATGALLALRGRIGRAPATAWLFFGGTLVPALGFVNVYPMRYSYVADHFQYLASIGPIALVTAAVARWCSARPALRWVTGTAAVLVLGALTWRQAPMYEDVEALWKTTIARNPESWMARNNLAKIRLDQGRWQEALALLDEALALAQRYPEAHNNRGIALLRLGRPEEAQREFETAIAQEPNLIEALSNLGDALRYQGRLDDAIARYREVIARRPDYADAHFNLGVAYRQTKRWAQAERHLRRVLAADPNDAAALYHLGSVLQAQGRHEDSLVQLTHAMNAAPGRIEPRLGAGVSLIALGRPARAAALLVEVLRRSPGHVQARRQLARALAAADLSDEERSYAAIEQTCRSIPEQLDAVYDTLGEYFARNGRIRLARRFGRRALELARRAGRSEAAARYRTRLESYGE